MTPQQLYDHSQHVLEGPDAAKLPDNILQMLYYAKRRALLNGAIPWPTDKDTETAQGPVLSDSIANTVRGIVESVRRENAIRKMLESLSFRYVESERGRTIPLWFCLSLSFISRELILKQAITVPPLLIKKNLLKESFKWVRAPPAVDSI